MGGCSILCCASHSLSAAGLQGLWINEDPSEASCRRWITSGWKAERRGRGLVKEPTGAVDVRLACVLRRKGTAHPEQKVHDGWVAGSKDTPGEMGGLWAVFKG